MRERPDVALRVMGGKEVILGCEGGGNLHLEEGKSLLWGGEGEISYI